MQYNNRLSELRGEMSQREFAAKIGLSQQNYGKYEQGKQKLNSELITLICKTFGCSAEWLLGLDGKKMNEQGVTHVKTSETYAPVAGCVHAGEACEAIQDREEKLWVPPVALGHNSNVYYLKVKGDSMDKILPEGSMALVDKNAHVDDGDIAVVFVNGDEATIKRVYFAGDTFVLHPESTNPEHLDIAINQRVPGAPEVRIDGKVVWYYPQFGKL